MQNQPTPITKKYRILVIDWDKVAAGSLLAKLGQIGVMGHLATDGRSGIMAFWQVKPHLLLINPALPDLDGFQLCTDLRRATNLPIVLTAAPCDNAVQVKGIKSGADRCIPQDIKAPLLRAEISSLLRRAYWYDHKRLPFALFAEHKIAPPSDEPMEEFFMPEDWITCDSCGYMGPSVKFMNRSAIQRTYTCPHCTQQDSLIFAI